MSELPRGDEPDPDDPRGPSNIPDFSAMFQQFLGDAGHPAMKDALKAMGIDTSNPATMSMLAAQLRALFDGAPADGINASLCEEVARKTVASTGDRSVGDAERREVTEAARVADLWLDEITAFGAPAAPPQAWSRAEWASRTMSTWVRLVDPIAQGVTDAVGSALRKQMDQLGQLDPSELPTVPGLPPGIDLAGMIGQLQPTLARMSSSMFGAQIGQAIGTLAGEVVSATEVGLPLLAEPAVVLLPANVAAFAEGLELDPAGVRLYLALRESARIRLFAGVPWLGPQLLAAVRTYAQDITFDTDAIERKLAEIDTADPQALQAALSSDLFSPDPSPAQRAARARMETLLALVEGWVDVVADRACAGRLPQASALGEVVRRRRATGAPAEAVFGELVGLQLRPRRLRDAANLFASLDSDGGAAARDRAWAHPDLMPDANDLDDVLGYVERYRSGATTDDGGEGPAVTSELDAALEQILNRADEARAHEAEQRATIVDGPIDAGPWPGSWKPRSQPEESLGAGAESDPSGDEEPEASDPEASDGEAPGPDASDGTTGGRT